MGWQGDYTFNYMKTKNKHNGAAAAYDKILGFIKRNQDATTQDIREFIIKEKKTV